MNLLARLRARLADITAEMSALNESAVGEKGVVRELTDEEKAKYESLKRSAAGTQEAIEREEALEKQRAEAARGERAAGELPSIQVKREHNHNESGEYRGFAPMDRGGFGEFLQVVAADARGERDNKRVKEVRAALGAQELVGADGGFLIQSDHASMLFDAAKDAGVIASECTVVPMSSNSMTINMVDETSLAVGSQFGGVQAYWRAEAASVTATRPKFREELIKLDALEALFYATAEQLEDAPNLQSFADRAFTTAMAFQLDQALVSGNGAGKPLGVLNAPCLITVAAEGGQTADTVVYNNVDNMVDRLMVGSELKAKWFIHPDVRKQLRNIYKAGTNSDWAVFLPQGAVNGTLFDQLFGYAVKRAQQMKKLGDVGDILLADWSQYLLFRKTGIQASQSAHVQFLTSQMAFKWTMRVAGQPAHNSAITDADGTTTRSPFITLATR